MGKEKYDKLTLSMGFDQFLATECTGVVTGAPALLSVRRLLIARGIMTTAWTQPLFGKIKLMGAFDLYRNKFQLTQVIRQVLLMNDVSFNLSDEVNQQVV